MNEIEAREYIEPGYDRFLLDQWIGAGTIPSNPEFGLLVVNNIYVGMYAGFCISTPDGHRHLLLDKR